jgi:hypothetical protein
VLINIIKINKLLSMYHLYQFERPSEGKDSHKKGICFTQNVAVTCTRNIYGLKNILLLTLIMR